MPGHPCSPASACTRPRHHFRRACHRACTPTDACMRSVHADGRMPHARTTCSLHATCKAACPRHPLPAASARPPACRRGLPVHLTRRRLPPGCVHMHVRVRGRCVGPPPTRSSPSAASRACLGRRRCQAAGAGAALGQQQPCRSLGDPEPEPAQQFGRAAGIRCVCMGGWGESPVCMLAWHGL